MTKIYYWRCAFFSALLFSLSFLASAPSFAVDSTSPQVVTIDSFSFPPLLHENENGEFSGTMGETVKMICKAGEMLCNFSVVPLKRAYFRINEGQSDALITIDVGQLKECCIPSDWSSPWTAGFFSSTGIDAIPEVPEELQGKSLIVVQGMKSPYLFAEKMDKMAEDKLLLLYKAPHILSSVRMFLAGRAPLLWGGEDFKWYIKKIDAEAKFDFMPMIELPVVIWVNKNKPEVIRRFNQAFIKLKELKILDKNFLLQPQLLDELYLDAPLPQLPLLFSCHNYMLCNI